jgi:serine/threonine-protein kinase RsbW
MTSPELLTVRLTVNASYADVRAVDAAVVDLLARAGGVDAETTAGVELAVHEVCTNIVDHAYGGTGEGKIEAVLTLTGGAHAEPRRLIVELQDSGLSFDRDAVAPVDLSIPHESGYGLYLAEALLDGVAYTRQPGRNVWRLTKQL